MTKQSSLVGIALVLLFMLPSYVASAQFNYESFHPSCREHWGPYLDRIVYNFIDNEDDQIRALIDDDIDLIDHPINSSFYDRLLEADNIMVETTPSNSYMGFVFNCAKYPFNITAFRRAFAYAIDKERFAEIWMDSGIQTARPLDACLIQESPFSAEGELSFDYTESDIDEAIRLLDDAMFVDSDSDGYRENPDGTDLMVKLEYFSMVQPMQSVCLETVEVFESIGINATILFNSAGFGFLDNGYFVRPHGNFDIAYLQYDFEALEVDWLAYEYWSEYADEPFINKPNFQNDTFDSYRDALLHSINYTEVWNAAIEMQKIIAYESPMVVSHELYDVYAYRTDRFTNFLNEITVGPGGWYSLCQLQLIDSLGGPYSGTFRIGTSKEVHSFNLLNSNEIESDNFLSLLYDSLLKRYPDGTIRQLLSTQWTVETNSINEDIPEGFTRIRFEIDSSAVWTDGTFCNAEDVIFSINYYRELEGHWLQERLGSLSAAYVQGNDAVFEFSSESFWHIYDVGFLPIIPKHFFEELPTDSYFDYNPNPPNDAMITLGPFNVSDYVAGEFLELTYYPDYYHMDSIDVPLSLDCGRIFWNGGETETLYSGQEYKIQWSVYGGCKEYTIYIDGTAYESSSGDTNRFTLILSTGPISFTTGFHTAEIVVSDYFGTNQSDIIEFNIHDPFLVTSATLVSTTTIVIVVYVILHRSRESRVNMALGHEN